MKRKIILVKELVGNSLERCSSIVFIVGSNFSVDDYMNGESEVCLVGTVKVCYCFASESREGLIRSCWNFDHKRRPQVSEIVEFLASNPRIISPCVDVPLASVQMDDDTGQLQMKLPSMTFRKCSVSVNFTSPATAAACAYLREPLLSSTDPLSTTEPSQNVELNSETESENMRAVSMF